MAAVNDVYAIRVVCRTDIVATMPVYAFNILHYRVDSVGGTGATEQQIADAFALKFSVPYKAILPFAATFMGVISNKVFPLPGALGAKSQLGQGAGARLLEIAPGQLTGLITKLTGFIGRRFRGRIYMPFVTVDDLDNTVPSAAYIAALNAILPEFVNSVDPGIAPNKTIMVPTILHTTPPLGSTDFGIVQSRNYFGTQRRRAEWRGPDANPF